MKLAIFGTGYVGLVTGACLADVGHTVLCVDVDQTKIDGLIDGLVPIYEPGLTELVMSNQNQKRLQFSSEINAAVGFADLIFIAVGTPPDEDGSADLSYVLKVAEIVGKLMTTEKIVVTKSTVPVGTAKKVQATIAEQLEQRAVELAFEVVSNPEFLKEGAAIEDCMRPDRIVVGTESGKVRSLMTQLYAPFNRNRDRMIFMDTASAELTKYAANAMLATKISFMNQMANIADKLGCDIELVRTGIGSDPRIGYHFIYPGCGYGGSCFPKDVRALIKTAQEHDYRAPLLEAVEAVNEQQKHVLFHRVNDYFAGNLTDKVVALWGLAFKPNTDDMRDAPSRVLMEALWQAGASVQAYDPEAMQECQRLYGGEPRLMLCGTKEQALKNADVLIICTEWKEFRAPDFDLIKSSLNSPIIFDGRNLFAPETMATLGFEYRAIGRRTPQQ